MFRRRSAITLTNMAERWDKEWISYFRRAPNYFDDFSQPNDDSRRRCDRVAAAVTEPFDGPRGPVDDRNPVWSIWAIGCRPDEIHRRAVADLGCGAGGIGRTIGYVSRTYVGIDYSPLALRVAELVSPPQCDYVLRSDTNAMNRLGRTIDTAFSRSVFIHQTFDEAVSLATVGAELLRSGGLLAVDFHRPEMNEQGAFLAPPRTAKRRIDKNRATVSYYFTDDEIADVGDHAGLELEAIIDAPERTWRIARFRRR